MVVDPSELDKFRNMENKCEFMFITLHNHIGALKEVKWVVRLIAGILIGAFIKSFF